MSVPVHRAARASRGRSCRRLPPRPRGGRLGLILEGRSMGLELSLVAIDKPADVNLILGQSHFIKTVEDLYEALVSSVPGIQFGLAFCEASGACLVRAEGTDDALKAVAVAAAQAIGAGHSFVIVLKDAFPVNVLNAVKACPEVCRIYCATANPLAGGRGRDGAGPRHPRRRRRVVPEGRRGRRRASRGGRSCCRRSATSAERPDAADERRQDGALAADPAASRARKPRTRVKGPEPKGGTDGIESQLAGLRAGRGDPRPLHLRRPRPLARPRLDGRSRGGEEPRADRRRPRRARPVGPEDDLGPLGALQPAPDGARPSRGRGLERPCRRARARARTTGSAPATAGPARRSAATATSTSSTPSTRCSRTWERRRRRRSRRP